MGVKEGGEGKHRITLNLSKMNGCDIETPPCIISSVVIPLLIFAKFTFVVL